MQMKRRRQIIRQDRLRIPAARKNEERQRQHKLSNNLIALLRRAISSLQTSTTMTYSSRNQASFVVALCSAMLYFGLLIGGAREIWTYPVIIGGLTCWILLEDEPRSFTKRRSSALSQWYQCLVCNSRQSLAKMFHKDIHHRLVKTTWIFIVVPCVTFFTLRAIKHIGSAHKKKANDFGFLAVVAMSYFLIPVSRQSVIMEAFGIGHAHATRLHIWAGLLALFGGTSHGLYYCWLWFINENKSLSDQIPFAGDKCWTWDYGKSCHDKFVNLLGFICGTAFLILGITSIWVVRRRFYRVFYFCHIGCSFVLVFGLAMHYNKMIWYLSPSFIYYLASNVPLCVEWIWKWVKGGTAIASFADIPDSGGCVELSLRIPDQASISLCGRYIRLAVPSISAKSHPFSCFVHSNYPGEVKFIFRAHGPFTKKLSTKLSRATKEDSISYPTIVVNGLRSGMDQWTHAMHHDAVVVFAGGVGIVTYISLLSFVASSSNSHDGLDGTEASVGIQRRRSLSVHWACRDEGLIEYITKKYLVPLRELARARSSQVQINVVIHHTSATSQESVVPQYSSSVGAENEISNSQLALASSFESGSDSLLGNLITGIAFGLIGIGGVIIVTYCYESIQEKHVAETRSIAVAALIMWSVAVAIIVFVVRRLSTCVPSKGVYSKLSKEVEIECIQLGESHSETEMSPESGGLEDTGQELDLNEESGEKCWMTIEHERERPNLKVSIQEAAKNSSKQAVDEIRSQNVGVFACGPNSLINAVRMTADSFTGGNTTGPHIDVSVYDEIFEL